MPLTQKDIARFRIPAGTKLDLARHDPGWVGDRSTRELGQDKLEDAARDFLRKNLGELSGAQELLWASDTYSVLVVIQAMDAAGKDGLIKHVMSGVNPQGCQVHSFKAPSAEELDHDFLWRHARALPERGRIGIFNRSYYEDVLVVKVHPEILAAGKLPPGPRGKSFWKARYADINAFEQHLARNGTVVIKLFLHVSKDEQRRRLLARLDDTEKHWKFSARDVAERDYWSEYMSAYEDAITATSTRWAPWHVIPADHKWITRVVVAEILTSTIQSLGLTYPAVTASQKEGFVAARRALEGS